MLFHSIRWRLQLWYGVILVAVLVGFGVTAYRLEYNRRFRSIDEELQRRMAALNAALQLNDPHNAGPDDPRDDFGSPPEFGPEHGRPRDGDFRPGPPPRKEFKLPAQFAVLFGGNEPTSYYYFIRSRNGELLSRSSNAPADRISMYQFAGPHIHVVGPFLPITVPAPNYAAELIQPSVKDGLNDSKGKSDPQARKPLTYQWPGTARELPSTTPPGEVLLVGRSIEPELAELRQFGWTLAGIGGIVLLCGLAGGWVLASRAIRPIDDISATAVKIAAGDLSQRIDAADTDNELGRLATVLNSTFARLETSFAQQNQFTADAAHELRTPVSVLLMQTQTVLKHERDSDEYRACIEACQRAGQRMRGLLESLLELARLDAGQEPMKKIRFDLGQAAAECVELVRPLALERNIQIETESPPLEWTGDKERVAQVITNLLTNAIHYNKDGGQVRVAVREQNHEAVITVSDTGMGIADTDLPRIFERFYRADKSRSNAKGRTGLGLAISRAIIEAHGGSIEAASQPGKGTTFTVRLPERD